MRVGAVGLGFAVVSAATFGTSGPLADSLLAAGWTPGSAVVFRIAIAAVVLTPFGLHALRGRWSMLRRGLPRLIAYGVGAVAVAQLFFFNAVSHLSVGVALLLEYCGTLLVVLWMWARHGQRPGRLTAGGGVLALVGLVFVLDLTGAQRVDLVGVLWAVGAAFGLASYFVLSSALPVDPADELPPITMAWGGMTVAAGALIVFCAVGVIPYSVATRDVTLAGHRVSWLVPVLGLSVVAAVVAYATGIAAARRLGARVASFVGLTEVLFAVLFAWVLLDQRPTASQGLGAVLVLAGIALVRAGDRSPAGALADPGAEPVLPAA